MLRCACVVYHILKLSDSARQLQIVSYSNKLRNKAKTLNKCRLSGLGIQSHDSVFWLRGYWCELLWLDLCKCSWGDLEDGILEFTGLKRHIVDGARLSLRVFRFQEVFVVEGSEDDIPK